MNTDNTWQSENGNYTRISNDILEALIRLPLSGTEVAMCLFVIRKTYGFNKKEDQISLSQFEKGIQKSRPTIVKSLKNLKLVNIIKLVKIGNSKISSNILKINENLSEWGLLVKEPELVKKRMPTSKEMDVQLVKEPLHTKERTKENTKESSSNAKKTSRRSKLTDEEFLEALKANPAYRHIDFDFELGKMDAWLIAPKGMGRKKTRGFILNWINKIDKPVFIPPPKSPPPPIMRTAPPSPEEHAALMRVMQAHKKPDLNKDSPPPPTDPPDLSGLVQGLAGKMAM